MKVTISFKNRSKTVVVDNLQKIEFIPDDPFTFDIDTKPEIIDSDFNKFRINKALDEITFIGDTTFSVMKSAIESLLFE